MSKLACRNIFLDTSTYRENNFSFDSYRLKKLKQLAKENLVRLYYTEITYNEVVKNMHQEIRDAINQLKSLKNKAYILRNINLFNFLFESYEERQLIDKLENDFRRFLEETQAEKIELNGINVDNLIELYFSSKAPFNKDKKKSEFPDAIVLLALEKYFYEFNEKLYIVSADSDMESYCENSSVLQHISKIDDFLSLFFSDTYTVTDYIINSLIPNNESLIEEALTEAFTEQLWFGIEDEDGEVLDVKVDYVDIEEEPNVIDLDIDKNQARISLECRFTYSTEVSYIDRENSFFDKEADDFIIEGYKEDEIEDDLLLNVELKIAYDKNDYSAITLEEISFLNRENIFVKVYDEVY